MQPTVVAATEFNADKDAEQLYEAFKGFGKFYIRPHGPTCVHRFTEYITKDDRFLAFWLRSGIVYVSFSMGIVIHA